MQPGLSGWCFSPMTDTVVTSSSRMDSFRSFSRQETGQVNMLYLIAIVVGLLFIIIWFSKELNESNKAKLLESSANNKKMDLSEKDVNLVAKILSAGLVDADPDYLQHLKGYRDLNGT